MSARFHSALLTVLGTGIFAIVVALAMLARATGRLGTVSFLGLIALGGIVAAVAAFEAVAVRDA